MVGTSGRAGFVQRQAVSEVQVPVTQSGTGVDSGIQEPGSAQRKPIRTCRWTKWKETGVEEVPDVSVLLEAARPGSAHRAWNEVAVWA